MNKNKSTLFRNKKGLYLGECHDVRDLSHDNHLYSIYTFRRNEVLNESPDGALDWRLTMTEVSLYYYLLISFTFSQSTINRVSFP